MTEVRLSSPVASYLVSSCSSGSEKSRLSFASRLASGWNRTCQFFSQNPGLSEIRSEFKSPFHPFQRCFWLLQAVIANAQVVGGARLNFVKFDRVFQEPHRLDMKSQLQK